MAGLAIGSGSICQLPKIWNAEAVNQLKHLTTALSKGFNIWVQHKVQRGRNCFIQCLSQSQGAYAKWYSNHHGGLFSMCFNNYRKINLSVRMTYSETSPTEFDASKPAIGRNREVRVRWHTASLPFGWMGSCPVKAQCKKGRYLQNLQIGSWEWLLSSCCFPMKTQPKFSQKLERQNGRILLTGSLKQSFLGSTWRKPGQVTEMCFLMPHQARRVSFFWKTFPQHV